MRIAVVGAGIAGTLLTWRLQQARPQDELTLYTNRARAGDATDASGGLVRGFETDTDAARLAAESLAELHARKRLRQWSGYQQTGSLYVLNGDDPAESLKVVEEFLPGSASVLHQGALHALGLHDLPDGTIAVAERRAGYLSPAKLRTEVLRHLAAAGVRTNPVPVTSADPGPRLSLADGLRPEHDVVVVAAGAWTSQLVESAERLRTKRIQYTLCLVRLPRLGAFVDDTSGLYGRAVSRDVALLGIPAPHWEVDPSAPAVDEELVNSLLVKARCRLGPARELTPIRSVASSDCYTAPAGLALRSCGPGLYTFTGGSGGAAKTVLAASRYAAAELLSHQRAG